MHDLSMATRPFCRGRTSKPVNQLRVAVVSDAIPQRNGVGAYYHDLSQHLANSVETFETLSPRVVDDTLEGGWSLPLPGDNTQRFCIPHFLNLKRSLGALQPEAVIVPTPGPYGIAGARYGSQLGARVLVGFHTWYEKLSELYWNRLQGGISKGFLHLSNRLLFRYADCVLANSTSMLETARRVGARHVELMGTPVAYDFVHQPVTEPAPIVGRILYAGRLAAEKNIDTIIEAARALPDIDFSFAGDGPSRLKVQDAASQLNNVHYFGWLDRRQLLQKIDSHDMLVLPSRVESFGTVALEAMARQRYTVVSWQCGITQWPRLTGGIFQIKRGESFLQALQRFNRMETEQRLSMARQARRAAVELNDWNCERWLELLQPQQTQVA